MENTFDDRMIAAFRAKYDQVEAEQEPVSEKILIGNGRIPLKREILLEGKCSMMLPDIMEDMAYEDRMVKYRHHRPPVIKTDENGDVTITFNKISLSEMKEAENTYKMLLQIQSDMKKVWKQNVFYDMGEERAGGLDVAWMDFKGFCLDGSLYSMIFIFRAEEQLIMGNFHCSFSQYDVWKPVIRKLLATVRTDM